jgi:hypothetical protein
MTALAEVKSLRNLDRALAASNRLRIEGTQHLLDAARTAGARRVIAQSYGLWAYAGTSTSGKAEDAELDTNPPATMRETLRAIRQLESVMPPADGVLADLVRKRKRPIVGNGAGAWSFVHLDEVAATIAAIERGPAGIYNVVDDELLPVELLERSSGCTRLGRRRTRRDWLRRLRQSLPARLVGARGVRPFRLPTARAPSP